MRNRSTEEKTTASEHQAFIDAGTQERTVQRPGTVAKAVVGITGTPALPAKIALAIDLHRRYGTEITALGIVDTGRIEQTGPVPVGAITFAREMRDRRLSVSLERARASLQKVEDGCREAGVPVRTVLVEDEPIEAISRQAHYNDLIVLPIDGWFTYGVISHAEARLSEVLMRGAGPILAIGEAYKPTQDVVVGLDGSLASAHAFKTFIRLGLWETANVHLVHSVEEAWSASEDSVTQMLDDALGYARRFGRSAVAHVVAGSPVDGLQEVIRETGASAAVLGSDRRRLFADRRLTTATKRLIRDQGMSVLISG